MITIIVVFFIFQQDEERETNHGSITTLEDFAKSTYDAKRASRVSSMLGDDTEAQANKGWALLRKHNLRGKNRICYQTYAKNELFMIFIIFTSI